MQAIVYQLHHKIRSSYLGSVFYGVGKLPNGKEIPVLVRMLAPHLANNSAFVKKCSDYYSKSRKVFHLNLANVWDFGFAGDYCFLVRPYVHGFSLEDLLAESDLLDYQLGSHSSMYLVLEFCKALGAFHFGVSHPKNNLFHGHILPSSIYLTESGNVFLADEGLFPLMWEYGEYRRDYIAQNGAYLSPEVIQGTPPDSSLDVFSLGMILYQLMLSPKERKKGRLRAPGEFIPPPSQFDEAIPSSLDHLLLGILENEVDKRTKSLQTFYQFLLDSFQSDSKMRGSAFLFQHTSFFQSLKEKYSISQTPSNEELFFSEPFQIQTLLEPIPSTFSPWERGTIDRFGAMIPKGQSVVRSTLSYLESNWESESEMDSFFSVEFKQNEIKKFTEESPPFETKTPVHETVQLISPKREDKRSEVERFGPYWLTTLIAQGGMAEIFKAIYDKEHHFKRWVAIKRIRKLLRDEVHIGKMFADEAMIMGLLNHPNIVQCYDYGKIDQQQYLVLEFVDGMDLAQVIKRQREKKEFLSLSFVVPAMIEICDAMDYAHNAVDLDGHCIQLVHRDLTPHNILLSHRGELKITDFGVAKTSLNQVHTSTGELKGKLYYLSPEQADGKEVSSRTDIYQMGVLLFELLTLQKMIQGKSGDNLLQMIKAGERSSIRKWNPQIPEKLQQIVDIASHVDPQKRFGSALELKQVLESFQVEYLLQPLSVNYATLLEHSVDSAFPREESNEKVETSSPHEEEDDDEIEDTVVQRQEKPQEVSYHSPFSAPSAGKNVISSQPKETFWEGLRKWKKENPKRMEKVRIVLWTGLFLFVIFIFYAIFSFLL